MWFICDYHMTMHHSSLQHALRANDVLPCQNKALSCQSHDILLPVKPKITQGTLASYPVLLMFFNVSHEKCTPDPFPPWGRNLGMTLTQLFLMMPPAMYIQVLLIGGVWQQDQCSYTCILNDEYC